MKQRYAFLDGLRGLAALSVVFFHLVSSPGHARFEAILPGFLVSLITKGYLGVDVFFVISGFAIAHSVRGLALTPGSVARFIARRQVRLDPCYWAALALAIANFTWSAHMARIPVALPGAGSLALHALYLQGLTGIHNILDPSWTLCIEIQFYLVFIFVLALTVRLPRGVSAGAILALVLASLWLDAPVQGAAQYTVFIQPWYMFALGVFASWVVAGEVPRSLLFTVLALVGVHFARTLKAEPLVALATAGTIYLVHQAGRLETLLGHGVWQFFGRISYPLYLVHLDVAWRVLGIGFNSAHSEGAFWWLWVAAALAATIAVATLMHYAIERPCLRLAARLKERPATAVRGAD